MRGYELKYIGERNAEGQKHGSGIFHDENGSEYEGYFVNDMKEGYGSIKYVNGDTYVGEWANDTINGRGELTNEYGKYKGEFLNGLNHGEGVLTKTDGTVVHDGKWEDNKPVINETEPDAESHTVEGTVIANPMGV